MALTQRVKVPLYPQRSKFRLFLLFRKKIKYAYKPPHTAKKKRGRERTVYKITSFKTDTTNN
jgi:hypothetical protein